MSTFNVFLFSSLFVYVPYELGWNLVFPCKHIIRSIKKFPAFYIAKIHYRCS
jgi:hypothetical protein